MFENPDAPASTLTKRELLRLAMVHAYLTAPSDASGPVASGPVMWAIAEILPDAVRIAIEERPETPPPPTAEEVVGAITAELEEAAAIARQFERMADGKTPRAVDAKGGEA